MPRPSAPSIVYHHRVFAVSGYIKPRHKAGTYPVQLRFERKEGSNWVLRKTVKAKVANYSSYSKYTASVALPYGGSWRVRAHHNGDPITATAGSGSTNSSYRSIWAR